MKRDIYTDDHDMFREAVVQFVAREITPRAEEIRETRRIPKEVWLKAGEAGFLGIGVPEEYGGAGLEDFRFNAVIQEELAKVGMAYGSSFGIHADVVAPYLVELSTPAQKERWLPRFCTGELLTAIGMTEPGAGSDLAALRTNAKRQDDGTWLLNGSKTFITNGLHAELVVVAARTSPGPSRSAISLFVLEEGMEGFVRGRKLDKVGQPEADTAELFFENVRVPAENLLGEEGRGFPYMMERLAQERLSAACVNIAHADIAVERTLEYVKERQAFGRPIGTFQNSRFKLASMVTEIEVTQAYVDRCLKAHLDGELTAVDAAKAKYWTAEVQNRVIDDCVQLYGGYGYMNEYEVARAWTDARVTRIWAGSNEIMQELIGRDLGLGDPRPAKPETRPVAANPA
ncbi:acyl-CoA dehydrogenase family protein [Patulibacter minatonensis]|uniref:acyl-CoA dehydrogenase family protein n=1 Tax=Patulibacter minatonensis TaxID=298163 RepID=UPI00068529D3|nr:acyl-CoA dehydrogenase family protein [Patulibacter minatonensis]